MLAKLDLRQFMSPVDVVADYSGYPWWHALLVEPNRETKAADWLMRVNVFAYLPTFTKQIRHGARQRSHRARLCAALPGMIFIPQEMTDIPRREEVFEYAHVHGFLSGVEGKPKVISKADIELIRLMEAKLNLPPEAKGVLFKLGQRVSFVNSLFGWSWGNGTVVEIASEHRIGIEVDHLFGRTTKVYVAASEIEAL